MASEGPTECPGVSGKTIETLNIFRDTANGTEIQIDFSVSNRTEVEANLSVCSAGEPEVLQRYKLD